jgi:hypothetical protein
VRRSPQTVFDGAEERWLLFQQKVDGYTARYAALWEAAEAATPRLGPDITLSEKIDREAQANRQLQEIKSHLQESPRCREQRETWCEALLPKVKEMARCNLGLAGAGLDLFFTRAGVEATRRFVRDAKQFEPSMTDEGLFQALRNLWIVHCIQLLLERDVSLSPAIFAYSMLYPCTDNYLDDPRVPGRSKVEFGDWLEQRLRGFRRLPANKHAVQVSRLVGLIEGCFPRSEFEEVHLSLRAIHHAQMASLEQQSWDSMDERSLLHATVRKGGTSVLADACLAAGQLSAAEADFMFGYGALLQLMDDLQDVLDDRANRHATIFARTAAAGLLDRVVSRLWSFGQAVLWSSGRFEAQRFKPVKRLIEQSCRLLLLQAAARNRSFYSAHFAAELEACSQFRFSFMRERAANLPGETRNIISLLRRRRQVNSAFDLLD